MVESDDLEFSDTPYAASFAVPEKASPRTSQGRTRGTSGRMQSTAYSPKRATTASSRRKEAEQGAQDQADVEVEFGGAPMQPNDTAKPLPRAVSGDEEVEALVQNALQKVQDLEKIPLRNAKEWTRAVTEILAPMREIQASWNELEFEVRAYDKPSAPVYAPGTRGRARSRFRGRGRGRGRA